MSQLALSNPSWEKDLSAEARRDLDYWRGILRPAMEHAGRGVERILKQTATMSGQPFKTVKNRFYRWRAEGLIGLVDKRLAGPLFWKVIESRTAPSVAQCRGIQELWRALCEENQRKSKPMFRKLVGMWKKRDQRIGAIPEYADFPGWPALPEGWTYGNLMRHGPTDYELKSVRIGRSAAASDRPTVFSTRAGLWVGSHYLFDDKWNDLFVNSFTSRQAGRPLEVYSLDLFSALKLRNATRVRTKDQEGNYQGIAEIMMRFVLAATLHELGYSPRGTVLVAEHGTAAVREKIARALHDMTGGKITLSESGMTGEERAHLGQYPGLSKGNFRHKAALESNNALEHNRRGALPGQTGMDVARRPEQLHGLLKYNARLLAAIDKLPPDKASLLDFPLLEINQYLNIAAHLDAEISRDREHELEGWIEAGNVVQSYKFGGQDILETALTAEQRSAIVPMIEAGLLQAEPMRMSRREVWERGSGDLIPLPGWGVCEILGDDLAREVTVRDNMIAIQDAEVGPGTFRFENAFRDPEGRAGTLRDAETYQGFINPFALGTLFVRDARGRYVGECRRIHAPGRTDIEAVHRAMGVAAKREAELLAPLAARHAEEAREKLARHRHNAAVIAEATSAPRVPAAEQKKRDDTSAALAEAARERAAAEDDPTANL